MDDEKGSASQTVTHKIAQGFDMSVKMTLVGARDIVGIGNLGRLKGCMPRKGAPVRNSELVDLPKDLLAKLQSADKKMVEWFAASQDNQKAFLQDPVAALQRAGIGLERSELQRLSRVRTAVGAAEVLPPGLQLRSVETAFATRRGAGLKPGAKSGDCGCGSNESEMGGK